ncbi:uncharacterized protein LOC125750242 isoform X1 [Brienomyrus brachyistius]|uniref:uncharacterized protein LOC125750242 isoform X1 n=1 Tax=Brienomyrus brachyistius TaxID=42636 RepID=UPI0020B345C0|nr:uncharacterized protein LOC125750242 isoform X1 [Brienomyrus brachyistius]XP_048883678.1 uncharacterized protein LOC125750242 isoform X1 [Brienomyrus brachyistius]XP_048883679.1 uncharacterized protein LOC125750242 isoform X1 [Brienomyrus brachyistius]XP_048883680.1 uncharacterized protein LOC125750242 isoform X1 [Brienomyrus brachyistius]XP_048883682.1 uncharacterized protein LOC125750242 isoform X1 [Brienomyrus brachyistius]XP_048883683.1 uncharacterized protein LOC125750242 isoform X1 [B
MAEPTGSRPPVLPGVSSRTLQHPSFLSLYMAVGSMQCSCRARSQSFPAPAMIPSDFFYNDPMQAPGNRIPNNVAQLEVFECCQLNTPAPIMSPSITSSIRPDPFRTEPHLIRDLGSQVWAWDHLCAPQTSTLGPTLRPRKEVIQLSAEEDQAITNLLKLHHESISEPIHERPCQPRWSPARCLPANQEDDANIDCIPQLTMTSKGQSGRWSDTELEAADILLTLDDGEVVIKEPRSLAQGDSESQNADTVDRCLLISSGLGPTSLGSPHVDSDDVNSVSSVEYSEIGQVDRVACGSAEESENLGEMDPQDDFHCGGSQWLEESSKRLQKWQEEEQLGLRMGLREETEGAVVSALLNLSQRPQGLPPS